MSEITDVEQLAAGARQLVHIGQDCGIKLRVFGGAGVVLSCTSARLPALQRTYGDIDLIGRSRDRLAVLEALERAGFEPDQAFNSVHAADRLWFRDPVRQYKIEVFFDRVSMCHTLELEGRLDAGEDALCPADLLLLKLQVVEMTEKDLKDATALLVDHQIGPGGIDGAYIAEFLATDWGWWKTATGSLDKVVEWSQGMASRVETEDNRLRLAPERAAELRDSINAMDKTRRWRMRARIGERLCWYETPDEVD